MTEPTAAIINNPGKMVFRLKASPAVATLDDSIDSEKREAAL